ncbi:MAG: tetratricopeptide repeat protein [Paracoccaceae bacterium]
MSETDSFIQEVSEEVRQDRMFALWKKWGPLVIGVIVLIVAATAYWSWTRTQEQAAAEALGGTFIAADPQVLDEQLALPDKIEGPAKVLAELAAAGTLAREGRAEDAATRYKALSDRAELPVEYRDIAMLQWARLTGGSEAVAALEPLLAEDRPFRVMALELRGTLYLGLGDMTAAHADWRAVMEDPTATPGARQRAAASLAATGGEIPGQSG